MRFSHDLAYDAAPEAVLAMLSDPAFREDVCRAMNAVRLDVSVDGSGAGMTVLIDQTQPARGIPSFARKFVGDDIRIVQRETWRDAAGATVEMQIPGKPAAFTGTVALARNGMGTVESVTGDVKVKIPMIGGKLEGLVADLMRTALENEQRVGRAWLAGHHS